MNITLFYGYMKDPDMTESQLAAAWINSQTSSPIVGIGKDEQRDSMRWAYGYLEDLCSTDPIKALSVIRAIINFSDNEDLLDLVASGPLESLLYRRGNDVIEIIITASLEDKKFAGVLGGVWQSGMSDELWDRLQKVLREKPL